jgi:hypothetical protein
MGGTAGRARGAAVQGVLAASGRQVPYSTVSTVAWPPIYRGTPAAAVGCRGPEGVRPHTNESSAGRRHTNFGAGLGPSGGNSDTPIPHRAFWAGGLRRGEKEDDIQGARAAAAAAAAAAAGRYRGLQGTTGGTAWRVTAPTAGIAGGYRASQGTTEGIAGGYRALQGASRGVQGTPASAPGGRVPCSALVGQSQEFP